MDDPRLFAIEQGGDESGESATTPIVFLHGFDGRAEIWAPLQDAVASPQRLTIAFDLPGHGRSRYYPGFGPPKAAARAVIAQLDARGIGSAHIVGHSMGGAIAALIGLFAPERVASLTLLAPGGFGKEIGAERIRAVMDAEGTDALRTALGGMGAPGWVPDSDTVAAIAAARDPAGRAAMRKIFDHLFSTGEQGVLPLDAIAATGRPVHVIWGSEDRVTPTARASSVPPEFTVTMLDGFGHMLMLEAPEACIAAIGAQIDEVEKR
ncbi:alpha/beta fold hydrolase [Aurantimonas marina]|uniref:alpha/beta fold hydrolase n=1 Tax=Aurantimonas marina TaxID=2780508 RepID=UPI0019CFD48A|nr:alpha/beta fold hydrolase [Aurantimonas marina]